MADPKDHRQPSWTDLPATPSEWPLQSPAPSKPDFAEFLVREFGITNPDIQSGLWSAIAFSAQWLLVDTFQRPDAKTLRRRLSQIEGCTDKLLEALTEPTDGLPRSSAPQQSPDLDFWLWRLLSDAEPYPVNTPRSTKLQLQQFKQLIETAKTNLSEAGTGRRKDETLWTWVEHLSPIWALYTNRPLTVDYHEGAPITPYTIFMHHAVRMLDPARESKLPSALDRYRTQQNRAKIVSNIPE